MSTPNPKVSKLQELIKVVDHFRTLDAEYPSQLIALVLQVATSPGQTMSTLAERTGMSVPSVSRNVERSGKRWGMNRQGEDLLEAEENPENRREKLVKLSPKGERFIQTLLSLTESR